MGSLASIVSIWITPKPRQDASLTAAIQGGMPDKTSRAIAEKGWLAREEGFIGLTVLAR